VPVPTAIVQSSAERPIATSAAAYAYGSSRTPEGFIRVAEYMFLDLQLIVPDRQQLETLVGLALKAQELFFGAALFHPDRHQLDYFFRQFITLAAVPTPPSAMRFSW
jgi:hypothetical protein